MEPAEQNRREHDDRRTAAGAVLHAVRAVAYATRAVAMVLPVDERQEFWASVRAASSEPAAPETETPLTEPASVDAESRAAIAEASESSDESFEFASAEGSNESTSPNRWVPRDTKEVPPHLRRDSPKRTDRAEVFFFDHWDEWFTAARVGREIGQDEKAAYSTLRQLEKVRGTIHRVDRGTWSTAPSRKWKKEWKEKAAPLREAIVEVLSEGRPLGTSGVVYAVKKARPDVSYGSVAAEIMRLRDQRILVERGHNGRGATYGLANGGTHAPDVT